MLLRAAKSTACISTFQWCRGKSDASADRNAENQKAEGLFALLSSGLADDVRIFVDDDDDDDDDTALCTLVIRLFRLLACFPAAESRFMFIISLLLSIQRAAAPFPPLSLCCFSLSHTQQRTRASFALLSEHLIAV